MSPLRRVAIVLPPDLEAPEPHRRHRFPHQGPALVAASLRLDGIASFAVDLDLDTWERPLACPTSALQDDARLDARLAGGADEELDALAGELVSRVADVDVDAFALSLDRHTQIKITLLLAIALKRAHGAPVVIGGGNARAALAWARTAEARGIDLITEAASPGEIRSVFRALARVERGRWELPVEPLVERAQTPPDDWPTPDFSIYDLARYRRDPFAIEGSRAMPGYDGSIGPRLFLPYHFSFDCQYACVFCERGGVQSAKTPERVVRDLAALAEAHDCADFMLFDTQINLLAEGLSRALADARLGVRWTDSYRVAPRRPADALDLMARAGCVGLTFGVESGSDRMLKRMVKGHTVEKATRIVQDAHAHDLWVRVNLLPCFPGERPEDHAQTVAWVEENARCIDDLAPSSFYLAEGSPVGQLASRFGIRVRGARLLKGEHKFRKNLGSLAFDEIDGPTWEEREVMLRPAEVQLLDAWHRSRGAAPISQPAQQFALSAVAITKREAYRRHREWTAGARPPEADAATVVIAAGSLASKLARAVARLVAPSGLVVTASRDGDSRLSFVVSDRRGESLTIVAERVRPDVPVFRRGRRVSVWYRAASPEPAWTAPVVARVAELLCSPAAEGLADELSPSAPVSLPRFGVLDLVRRGVKPAASLLVDDDADLAALTAGVAASVVSGTALERDARHDLVPVVAPSPRARRMLYVGASRAVVERLRDVEAQLFSSRGDAGSIARLHAELGETLGFPPCCAAAFARTAGEPRPRGDVRFAIERGGWHLAPLPWWANHPVALLLGMPFLLHVPCGVDCAETRALVTTTVGALYTPAEAELVRRVLSQGLVVFAGDAAIPFTPTGPRSADGALPIASFNREHPAMPWGDDARRLGRDRGPIADADVEALRVRGDELEVAARGRFVRYPSPPGDGGPLVVAPVPA